jgi:hypothetical protein
VVAPSTAGASPDDATCPGVAVLGWRHVLVVIPAVAAWC